MKSRPKFKSIKVTRRIAVLSVAISRSIPPITMPGYWRVWRCWWRIGVGLMRRGGLRERAARDAVHDRLLGHYQAAAARREGPR